MIQPPLREQVRMLSGVDVLEPLSDEELEELAARRPDVQFRSGEIFSMPYEDDDRFFIIKQGRVRVYKLSPEGREQTLAEVRHGTVLAAQRLQGSYAQAVEPTIILPLNREDMRYLVQRNPEVALRLTEVLARRLRQSDERLADIVLKEVPARLASLILQLIEDEGVVTREGYMIPTRYSHERLGTMIGARRVAVSRAVGKLREIGAVELKRRHFYVPDIEALRRAAETERSSIRFTNPGRSSQPARDCAKESRMPVKRFLKVP